MIKPFETGKPLMEQVSAMPAHVDRLGHIAASALLKPQDAPDVIGGTVMTSKSIDGGDVIHTVNYIDHPERGARITVGEYKKGIANGQRETTVAATGEIKRINTVELTAAEATRIASSLKKL